VRLLCATAGRGKERITTDVTDTMYPKAAASAAIFRGRDVLLIQRGKGALQGYWSLPGGHIEPGERARDAALREVREETGVAADLRGLVDLHEVILRDAAGGVQAHYLIAVHAGLWLSGTPVAAEDAADARFVPPEGLGDLQLTDGALGLIARARAMVEAEAGGA